MIADLYEAPYSLRRLVRRGNTWQAALAVDGTRLVPRHPAMRAGLLAGQPTDARGGTLVQRIERVCFTTP
ncbi:hypothetical protein [Streptomyces sp. NPDC057428]|uniref:hypothetical protein n=1 Tax=Streptomyces sp. NPDC057428 TaxID=3346129 RepID=UPI0036CC2F9A